MSNVGQENEIERHHTKTSKQIYLIDAGLYPEESYALNGTSTQTGRTNANVRKCNIKTLQKVEIMCRLGVSGILGKS